MPVRNTDIARTFENYAMLLEIDGANPFRVRAYQNAARTLEELPRRVADLLEEGEDLSRLAGIGKDLAAKIQEIVETGHLSSFEELQARTPGDLIEVAALPGLGPKRVKTLHDRLGIENLRDLERAARAGKVQALPGFGQKTEERILNAIRRRLNTERRLQLLQAQQLAEPLLDHLRKAAGVKAVVVAGSYRRCSETVRSRHARDGEQVVHSYGAFRRIRGRRRNRFQRHHPLHREASGRNTSRPEGRPPGVLRSCASVFTGSKAHNIALRALAMKRGLKLSEYGVFKKERRVAGRSEKEVYAALELPYIEPELREDRGEIEAARGGKLPRLIRLNDIRGDLHCHTNATDGRDTIEAMAKAARKLGYRYLAISDHTRHLGVAHGLDARRLRSQLEEIDRVNDRLSGIRLLKSAEVEILGDGSLDLPDEVLRKLDFTVCAVHTQLELSRDKQTERIIRAMDNPCFNIFAHPSGRLLGEREPYAVDMERLMAAALERGCFFELNAQPARLDLSDLDCNMAKAMGLKVAISTDAHSAGQLSHMRLGLSQARRGWLSREDVLNTRNWNELRELLKR